MIQKKQAYASQNEQSKSYGIHISFIRITWNDESRRDWKWTVNENGQSTKMDGPEIQN